MEISSEAIFSNILLRSWACLSVRLLCGFVDHFNLVPRAFPYNHLSRRQSYHELNEVKFQNVRRPYWRFSWENVGTWLRKKVNMESPSPRFRSQQLLFCKICGEMFYPLIDRDLYGDAMLKPTRMSSNMAAGNQQEHLSLSLATEAWIYLSWNSRT